MNEQKKSNDQVGNAGSVSKLVTEIRDISQSSSGFELHAPPQGDEHDLVPKIYSPTVEWEHIDDQLFVSLSVKFSGVLRSKKNDQEECPLFDVNAVFIVHYQLESACELAEEDLRAFSTLNGMLNVTPFWREYILDCMSRSKMPAYYLPPFNVAKMIAAASGNAD